VSTSLFDVLILIVALFAVVASFYYFVTGVLSNDRLLSRSAMVAFVLFGVLAAVYLVRLL
jgi:hypothetical protein